MSFNLCWTSSPQMAETPSTFPSNAGRGPLQMYHHCHKRLACPDGAGLLDWDAAKPLASATKPRTLGHSKSRTSQRRRYLGAVVALLPRDLARQLFGELYRLLRLQNHRDSCQHSSTHTPAFKSILNVRSFDFGSLIVDQTWLYRLSTRRELSTAARVQLHASTVTATSPSRRNTPQRAFKAKEIKQCKCERLR